jgi:hypothetical protein
MATPSLHRLPRLHAAINARRPHNGFITSSFILDGWVAGIAYRTVRS